MKGIDIDDDVRQDPCSAFDLTNTNTIKKQNGQEVTAVDASSVTCELELDQDDKEVSRIIVTGLTQE